METPAAPLTLPSAYAPLTGAQWGHFPLQATLGGAEAEDSGPSWEGISRDAFGLLAPNAVMPPRAYTTLGCATAANGSLLGMVHQGLDQVPSTPQMEGVELAVSLADFGVRLANHSIGTAEAAYAGGSVLVRGLAMVVEHCGHPAWATAGRAAALGLTIMQRLATHPASKHQFPARTLLTEARIGSPPSGPGSAAAPPPVPRAG